MLIVNRRLGERVICDDGDGRVLVCRLVSIVWPNKIEMEFSGPTGPPRLKTFAFDESTTVMLGTQSVRVVNCGHSTTSARLGFVAPRAVSILRSEIIRNTPNNAWRPSDDFSEGIPL